MNKKIFIKYKVIKKMNKNRNNKHISLPKIRYLSLFTKLRNIHVSIIYTTFDWKRAFICFSSSLIIELLSVRIYLPSPSIK